MRQMSFWKVDVISGDTNYQRLWPIIEGCSRLSKAAADYRKLWPIVQGCAQEQHPIVSHNPRELQPGAYGGRQRFFPHQRHLANDVPNPSRQPPKCSQKRTNPRTNCQLDPRFSHRSRLFASRSLREDFDCFGVPAADCFGASDVPSFLDEGDNA